MSRSKDKLHPQCKKCVLAQQKHRRESDPAYRERNKCRVAAWKRGEKLEPIGKARPADERFDDKWMPEPNTGCHLWTGCRTKKGYGKLGLGGKYPYAHRWAYERAFGPIPDGLELHHTCHTPSCCNPEHLLEVTREQHEALHAAR